MITEGGEGGGGQQPPHHARSPPPAQVQHVTGQARVGRDGRDIHRIQLGDFLIWKIILLKTQHGNTRFTSQWKRSLAPKIRRAGAELNKMAALQSNIPDRQLFESSLPVAERVLALVLECLLEPLPLGPCIKEHPLLSNDKNKN